MEQRVQKLLAQAGVASRRDCEAIIEQGRVLVNGRKIKLGDKASTSDDIRVDGKRIVFPEKIVLMLNKPRGYLSTVDDPEKRKTIMELLPSGEKLYPVGRLDKDTEGLLLITNDGDFAQSVAHPSKEIKKTYVAIVDKPIRDKDVDRLNKGVRLEETVIREIFAKKLDDKKIQVILHVGQKHIVKDILGSIGFKVVALERTHIGKLGLGDLRRGQYRTLLPQDIKRVFEQPV